MKRRALLGGGASLLVLASLNGCTRSDYPRASQEEVEAAFYRSDAPPSISLMSMVSEASERSEHVGILINGSQRVLYDPAGDYYVLSRPRRDDIHYGMTDQWVQHYESFHSRLGFYVEKLTIPVSLQVADLAIARSQERGETYHTQCATSASWVLSGLPGFERIPRTMSPDTIRQVFATLPGVQTDIIRESDRGQNLEPVPVAGYDPQNTAPPIRPEYGRGGGE